MLYWHFGDDLIYFLNKIISYFHLSLADRGVNALEDGAGECCSFTSSRLSLGDHVSSLHYWLDCSLLDGRGFLESVCVDSSGKCVNFKYFSWNWDDVNTSTNPLWDPWNQKLEWPQHLQMSQTQHWPDHRQLREPWLPCFFSSEINQVLFCICKQR